ncbi:MAG: hypothetical protein AAF321_02820 [Pseudomonadota bacterium]
MIGRGGPASLLWLLAGFTIWSAAFLGLYIVHALGCEWGWQGRVLAGLCLLRLALIVVWVAHLALALVVLRLAVHARQVEGPSDTPRLVFTAGFGLAIAALLSTFWTGLPIVALPLCR